ncbi:helix-turn-helix transcriptional regulator [Stigmatella sp. ncwal1]|uniref:Helix-turn-helix transcriptional regulator n=1 Tax=Stigmatella ashevillensis TaxID=2995309 RepID=A0ABT5DGZ6_9BACT|nr:helix-turn-helix transcriptional regulator [Stigmatella ashevillena]MDC0712930.1 helix-turn-helix transcriptional regulator [Stigmatella ashevillena]
MNRRERLLVNKLMEALIYSQNLPELVNSTEGLLSQLVSADCLALCASKLGQPTREDWLVAKMPEVYFAHYAEWKKDDLIRDANMKQPNVVLRDTEIIARADLESSTVYRIGHGMGVPLEQVMSVYLTEAGWEGNGGFSAYRMKRQPFSNRERDILQHITPLLSKTIQKCRVFTERELMERLLENQPEGQKPAFLVMAAPTEEVKRTGPVADLIRKWFSPTECDASGMPHLILRRLAFLMSHASSLDTGTDCWDRLGEEETLRVTFIQLPRMDGQSYWQLRFQEVTHPLLTSWLKKMTPKEAEIANFLVQGLTDKEIAQKTDKELGTVKKQLGSIYDKLKDDGVDSRATFIARALLPRKKPD